MLMIVNENDIKTLQNYPNTQVREILFIMGYLTLFLVDNVYNINSISSTDQKGLLMFMDVVGYLSVKNSSNALQKQTG